MLTALTERGLHGAALPPLVVVTVFDKTDAARAFAMAQELRAAGIRAEAYVGNGKMGDQFKYADKRGAAIAVIEGGDERARGEVTLKDLALGAELAKSVESRADWVANREAQKSVPARRPGGRNQGDAEGQGVMATFPYYDAGALRRWTRRLRRSWACSRARGYVHEEPSVLQPAEIFLDRSGEEIRRRTFTLTDPSGRDLALRPDLTIPICRDAVLSGRKWPARICYNGLVFRHQPGEPHRPTQFFQAGAELLGLDDRAAGETEILSLAIEALRVAGLKDFSLRIGDLALFNALVDALALPGQWRSRLKRHFWRAGYVESLLYWLGHGDGAPKLPGTRAEIEALLDA